MQGKSTFDRWTDIHVTFIVKPYWMFARQSNVQAKLTMISNIPKIVPKPKFRLCLNHHSFDSQQSLWKAFPYSTKTKTLYNGTFYSLLSTFQRIILQNVFISFWLCQVNNAISLLAVPPTPTPTPTESKDLRTIWNKVEEVVKQHIKIYRNNIKWAYTTCIQLITWTLPFHLKP